MEKGGVKNGPLFFLSSIYKAFRGVILLNNINHINWLAEIFRISAPGIFFSVPVRKK